MANFWRAVHRYQQTNGKGQHPAQSDDREVKHGFQPWAYDKWYEDSQAYNERPLVHFVGFRGEEYWSAVRVWGTPDFIHRVNDNRLLNGGEKCDQDVVIYANQYESKHTNFSFDDSAQF